MTDELSKLFRDAMDWGRSYGQRINTPYEVLDEVASQFADRARAIESAATAQLLERIAELDAKLAQPVPDDFLSHKAAWRNALVLAEECADTDDDVAYWQHELRAYDKAHAALSAAPAAPEQQDIPPEMAEVLEKNLWELYSDGSAPEQQKECWCETCDLSQGNPMGRTRMSVCPQCGDKRCPRAKHHDSACQVAKASNAQQAAKQALTDPENQPNQHGFECFVKGQKMAFRIGNQTFTLDYEPDETEEFDFMRDMLANAFSTFTPDVKAAQQAEPMCRIAKLKLAELIANGYRECGVMIEFNHQDGKVTRGAVSNGGMVIWWHPEQMEAAHSGAQQAEAQEPALWANFTPGGNIRLWAKTPESVMWSGLELVPLFTRPQPAQPLTRDQVSQMLQAAGYFAASPQENADFINGVRHAEIAHGIGVAK